MESENLKGLLLKSEETHSYQNIQKYSEIEAEISILKFKVKE